MNKQELKFILQSGEGLKTEFKENANEGRALESH